MRDDQLKRKVIICVKLLAGQIRWCKDQAALIFPRRLRDQMKGRRGIADPRGGCRSDVKRFVSSALLRFRPHHRLRGQRTSRVLLELAPAGGHMRRTLEDHARFEAENCRVLNSSGSIRLNDVLEVQLKECPLGDLNSIIDFRARLCSWAG